MATIIMRITYGYTVTSETDTFMTEALTSIANFSLASAPGAWLVDVVPQREHGSVPLF